MADVPGDEAMGQGGGRDENVLDTDPLAPGLEVGQEFSRPYRRSSITHTDEVNRESAAAARRRSMTAGAGRFFITSDSPYVSRR